MSSSSSTNGVRKAACDSCKAKRVLCHPQPDGSPCPRCADKQILCKTTYVPRGRPKKNPQTSLESTTRAGSLNSSSDASTAARNLLSNTELVKHLYSYFPKISQQGHPLFRVVNLDKLLAAASWRLDLLHPQASALAHCICALSATIATHSDIIGTDTDLYAPTSLSDPHCFFLGADLRAYGSRRAAACRLLANYARSIATDSHVQIEVSECNTLSCFLLDALEEDVDAPRPWAASYMSHVHTLMSSWPKEIPFRRLWTGYLLAEVFKSTVCRQPTLVTMADQLLVSDGSTRSLESLLEEAHKQSTAPSPRKEPAYFVFEVMPVFIFHSTRLAREFHENISGDYARRRPISELALRNIINDLTSIHAILSFCFTGMEFPPESPALAFGVDNRDVAPRPLPQKPETSLQVRTCAFALSCVFVGMVMALHGELQRRFSEVSAATTPITPHIYSEDSPGGSGSTGSSSPQSTHSSPQPHWSSARIAFLRAQAHSLVISALPDLRRMLTLMTFPLYGLATQRANFMAWAQFCIDEADQCGGIAGVGVTSGLDTQEAIKTYEQLLYALKGMGFSHAGDRLNVLIDRMEQHVNLHRGWQQELPPNGGNMEMSIFTDPSPPPAPMGDITMELQMMSQTMPEMALLLDDRSWLHNSQSLDM
ncbi:Zn(2)-C6 fungal-type domain-containing protein [Mycena kentingensis (nom. inval.)]|nr:Zn(2)-C6 fungal-type domain-containing protein [Mycena kentingensis (nom. inval.)]